MLDWPYSTPDAPHGLASNARHGRRRLGSLRASGACAALLVASCQPVGILDPQGPIASAERLLMINSFFIPQLASQIYTMGGMTTHLNLLADEQGEYPGFSANFSGDGFAEMRFIAKAVPAGDFDAWVARVRGTGPALDEAGYTQL